jgi:LPS export ABC transporter permease LptF
MKLLHRYIISEFIESFLFGLSVFSIILLLDQIFQLIDLFLSKGISFFIVFKLFLLILPNIFSLTIPMAGLVGILLAFGRLAEDNEITAMRSSGIKYTSIASPVLLLMLLLSVFLVYFNQYLSPSTHSQFRKIYQQVISSRPLIKFEEKAITKIGDYRLYVSRVNKDMNSLESVSIYKFSKNENDSAWRITASSAVVAVNQNAVIFNLFKGYWQKPNPAKPADLVHMNFAFYQFTIPLVSDVMPFSQSLREMTASEMKTEIKNYRLKKLPVTFLETEYWLRWTLALAPFVFAVCGIPLGVVSERGGKSVGFGISLVVLFVFYFMLVAALNISEKGYVNPAIAMWLPDVVILCCGAFLWKRMLKA